MARESAVKEREAPAPAALKAEQQLDLPNIEAAPAPAASSEKSDRQQRREAEQQSLMQRISSKVEHKPPRIFLYGVHGIGK
jgi:hypothetical protein